jgi:hypothetical protein
MYITIPTEISDYIDYKFDLNPFLCPNLAYECSDYAVSSTLSSSDIGLTSNETYHLTTVSVYTDSLDVEGISSFFLVYLPDGDSIVVYYDYLTTYECINIYSLNITEVDETYVYILNSGLLQVPVDYTITPSACENETITLNFTVTPETSYVETSSSVSLSNTTGFEIDVNFMNPYDSTEELLWQYSDSDNEINITATILETSAKLNFTLQVVDCTP